MENVTKRQHSILTKKNNLEHIFHISNFPVYAGCVETNPDKDVFLDLDVSICKDTGIIQLDSVPPIELVYLNPHNDAIGKTWQDHHEEFSSFIAKFNAKKILEIGGGTTRMANMVKGKSGKCHWTIIDPNMIDSQQNDIQIVNEYFRKDLPIDNDYEAVVHSHTLEHMKDPVQFVRDVSNYLKKGGLMIFSFPNMQEWLSRKYLNCINFEHPQFLIEPFVDVILKKEGFEILEKKQFRDDHSLFYATKFTGEKNDLIFPNLYDHNKKIYLDFVNYYQSFVNDLNSKLENFHGEIYLFGAHMFSQYLLWFGLNENKVSGILDNSTLKIGKRLYGTKFNVFHPEIIKNKNVGVIMKVGSYRNEIVEQLQKINPSVIIFE